MRSLQSFLPLKISSRASLTQPGQSESVWRGHPSVGLVFSQDFNKGLSDHFGVKEGLGWYLLKNWIVSKATLAVLHRSASKIFRTFVAFLLGMAMIPPFRSRWTDDPLTPIRPRLSLEVPADYSSLGAHTRTILTKSLCCQSLPVTPVSVQPYVPKGTKTGVNGTLLHPTATRWRRGLEFGVSDKWHQVQGLGSAGDGFNRLRPVSERQWRNAPPGGALPRAGTNLPRHKLSATWLRSTR